MRTSPASARTRALGAGIASAAIVTAATAAVAGGHLHAGTAGGSSYHHVIVIPEENHGYGQIIGSNQAPYINSLASTYGLATNYTAGVPAADHSLPSYLLMTAGTPGVNVNGSDCAPSACPQPEDSVFHQASVAGIGWHGYAESIPSNCDRSATAGLYAARHLPAPYFTDLSDCTTNDTGLTPLASDLTAGLPAAYNMVTPNLADDMHNGSVAQGDAWLRTWVPKMMAGKDYQAGDLAIFITWDEGTGSSNQVATIVISPTTSSVKDATPYTHASLLRTTEDLLGLPALGAAAAAPSMVAGFHLGGGAGPTPTPTSGSPTASPSPSPSPTDSPTASPSGRDRDHRCKAPDAGSSLDRNHRQRCECRGGDRRRCPRR